MINLWTRLLSSSFSWTDGLASMVQVLTSVRAGEHGKVLAGGGSPDFLEGGDGDDLIWGARGDDVLWGGAGADLVHGGQGADVLAGGVGADWLQGGAGSDYLSGADLTDSFGELDSATDTLDGGSGNDRLAGGSGGDTLIGGRGDDLLAGNEGADVFVFDRRAFGHDLIVDFTPGEDRIDLSGLGLRFEQLDINGDGAVTTDDSGINPRGPSLAIAVRGGVVELVGVAALDASDFLF